MTSNNRIESDPSSVHEPGKSTSQEMGYRELLGSYFNTSVGSDVEKLEQFAKYVPRQTLTTFMAKYEIFKKIIDVPGSVVECGVYHGGGLMAFAQMSAILEPFHYKRKIIGFDTFSGFTGISEKDKSQGTSTHATAGGFSVEGDVYADLEKCIGLYDQNRSISHIEKIKLIKGDITVTLPKFLIDQPHTMVSLLYLDMDVYEPTKVAIDLLVPRMPKGGIIVFDELNDERWPGETLALADSLGISSMRFQRLAFDPYLSFAVIE